jgi:hypothetical protein
MKHRSIPCTWHAMRVPLLVGCFGILSFLYWCTALPSSADPLGSTPRPMSYSVADGGSSVPAKTATLTSYADSSMVLNPSPDDDRCADKRLYLEIANDELRQVPVLSFAIPPEARNGQVRSARLELTVAQESEPVDATLWLKPITCTWYCTDTWSTFCGGQPPDQDGEKIERRKWNVPAGSIIFFDVAEWLQTNSGHYTETVSFLVQGLAFGDRDIVFYSSENAKFRPMLLLSYDPVTSTPSPTLTPTPVSRSLIPYVRNHPCSATPSATATFTPTPTLPCPRPTVVLWDDGEVDNQHIPEKGRIGAVRFTIDSPKRIVALEYYIWTGQISDSEGNVSLSLRQPWDDAEYTHTAKFEQSDNSRWYWYRHEIPNGIELEEGDFFVALEWLGDSGPHIGFDADDPDERSYEGTIADKELIKKRDLMIRAVVCDTGH